MVGVVGIIDKKGEDAAGLNVEYLHRIQHRGHGGASIVSLQPDTDFLTLTSPGLVLDGLADELNATPEDRKKARASVGLLSNKHDTAPAISTMNTRHGCMGIVFGGYCPNMEQLIVDLMSEGAVLGSRNPAVVMGHMIGRSSVPQYHVLDALSEVVGKVEGRYACLLVTKDGIYAARDPSGKEPLSIYMGDDITVISSETCAFPTGSKFVDVEPGSVVSLDAAGHTQKHILKERKDERCLYELVWGGHPTSIIYGEPVSTFRVKAGEKLGCKYGEKVVGLSVIPLYDSGTNYGDGFVNKTRSQRAAALVRGHYLRQPDRLRVADKFQVDGNLVARGQDVVVIDDSINAGDTAKYIATKLKEAGAGRVLFMSATPPRTRCRYRPPPREPLLAERYDNTNDMKRELGVDGFYTLTLDELLGCLSKPGERSHYCTECFRKFG